MLLSSYRLDETLLHKFLHGKPGVGGVDGLVVDDVSVLLLGERFLPPLEGVRPVYEVEVQIVQAEVGECFPAGGLHIVRVVFVVPQLAGDEHLLPRHA